MSALDKQVGGNHYKNLRFQPIEYITKNELGFCEGNIVKYVTRWKVKGGREDLEKVIHYAQLLLDGLEPAEPVSFGEAAMKAQFQAAIERDEGTNIYYNPTTAKYYVK